jgi:hypothetical protein
MAVINRNEELKTFSITQAVIEKKQSDHLPLWFDGPRRFQYFIYHYLIIEIITIQDNALGGLFRLFIFLSISFGLLFYESKIYFFL